VVLVSDCLSVGLTSLLFVRFPVGPPDWSGFLPPCVSRGLSGGGWVGGCCGVGFGGWGGWGGVVLAGWGRVVLAG
jgi:hypothetical protein